MPLGRFLQPAAKVYGTARAERTFLSQIQRIPKCVSQINNVNAQEGRAAVPKRTAGGRADTAPEKTSPPNRAAEMPRGAHSCLTGKVVGEGRRRTSSCQPGYGIQGRASLHVWTVEVRWGGRYRPKTNSLLCQKGPLRSVRNPTSSKWVHHCPRGHE